MTRALLCLLVAATGLAAGCSDSHNARSSSPPSTGAQTSGTGSTTSPTTQSRPTTKPTRIAASYGCGPGDGPFVTVKVVAGAPMEVVARAAFHGRYYGESQATKVSASHVATLGFDPALPQGAYGEIGAVALFRAGTHGQAPVAVHAVRYRNPPGLLCG